MPPPPVFCSVLLCSAPIPVHTDKTKCCVINMESAQAVTAASWPTLTKVVSVSYSHHSSCAESRLSILQKTSNQWLALGFDVHVTSDGELEGLDPRVVVRVVTSPRQGQYGLPWEAIDTLKGLPKQYSIYAYAEDDIFVPERAIKAWLEITEETQGTDILAGFYRIESSDESSLTDHRRFANKVLAWLDRAGRGGEEGPQSIAAPDGCVYMDEPYAAMWVLTRNQFEEYSASKWSDWDTCPNPEVSRLPIRETAGIGLTQYRPTLVKWCSAVHHMCPTYADERCWQRQDLADLISSIHGHGERKPSQRPVILLIVALGCCALILVVAWRSMAMRG